MSAILRDQREFSTQLRITRFVIVRFERIKNQSIVHLMIYLKSFEFNFIKRFVEAVEIIKKRVISKNQVFMELDN